MSSIRQNSPVVSPSARRLERAALVGLVQTGRRRTEPRSLDELAGLAEAAGAAVVLRVVQERGRPDPATFLGRGKVDTLRHAVSESDIEVVVVDNDLSPAQSRNLETALACKVVDRTELILDIFARRARTREGKLQVELAQLKYLLPRLVGAGRALSRLGGGIGTRGPGETKLESDRRRIRHRLATLTRQIDDVRDRRSRLRERRTKSVVPTVALVGYTNAGKTTLFNRLTRERAAVSDALFVTLDPLVRRVRLPDRRELLVSDTVGFIDDLPHALVAAFRATLEEVVEANLLLHVIDASAGDLPRRLRAVQRVLAEVGADRVPVLDVFNKWDAADDATRARIRGRHPRAVCVSALTGDGVPALVDAVASALALGTRRVRLEFDGSREADRRRIAELYRHASVIGHEAVDGRISIEADVSVSLLERLRADSREAPPQNRRETSS